MIIFYNVKMTRKIDIINLITSELKKINGLPDTRRGLPKTPYTYKTKVHQVFPTFKSFDEINDFPSLYLVASAEARRHIGGGIRYGDFNLNVRGYVHSENVVNEEDDLLDDIEFILNTISFLGTGCSSDIEEVRVVSIGSDEGLSEPFGVCEVECEITYQLSEDI